MKKGFTLVELLGIVFVLGLVVVFTVPTVMNTIKNSDDKEYENFLSTISMAAETYYYSNTSICDFENETCSIELKELIDAKLINENLVNPKTGKTISALDTVLLVKNENNQIEYSYSETN